MMIGSVVKRYQYTQKVEQKVFLTEQCKVASKFEVTVCQTTNGQRSSYYTRNIDSSSNSCRLSVSAATDIARYFSFALLFANCFVLFNVKALFSTCCMFR